MAKSKKETPEKGTWGGRRPNQTGPKMKYGEPTEPRRIPISLLPQVDKMLEEKLTKPT